MLSSANRYQSKILNYSFKLSRVDGHVIELFNTKVKGENVTVASFTIKSHKSETF